MTDEDIIELTAGKGVNPFKEAREALREKVARAMYDRWRTTRPNAPIFDNLFQEARESELLDASVAIDLALEEAAQVANSMYKKGQIGEDIAAAIRALKPS